MLSWRLRATSPTLDADGVADALARPPIEVAHHEVLRGRRDAYFPDDGFTSTPVYDRYTLAPGDTFDGPAIVEERESTVIVGPCSRFTIDEHRTLVLEIETDHSDPP